MGGGGQNRAVQKADPWEGIQPYLKRLYAEAQDLYEQGPQQYFPGRTYADFTPQQLRGMYGALGYADRLGGFTGRTLDSTGRLIEGGNQVTDQFQQTLPASATTMTRLMGGGSNPYQLLLPGTIGGLNRVVAEAIDNPMEAAIPAATSGMLRMLQPQGTPYDFTAYRSAGTLSRLMNPQQNPYLDRMALGAMSNASRTFMDAMRGVRAETQAAGQTIGDTAYRRGLDVASRNLSNALSGIATNLYGQQYQSDMNRSLQAASEAGRLYSSGRDAGQGRALEAARTIGSLYTQLKGQGLQSTVDAARAGGSLYSDLYSGNMDRALRAAGLSAESYTRGLDLSQRGQLQALGLAPSIARLGLMPSQIYQNVGSQFRAMNQAAIDDAMARWQFEQNAPYQNLQQFAAILGGIPVTGGTTASTAPVNRMMSGAGGAMTGYALATLIAPELAIPAALFGGGLGYFGA